MTNSYLHIHVYALLISSVLVTACSGQDRTNLPADSSNVRRDSAMEPETIPYETMPQGNRLTNQVSGPPYIEPDTALRVSEFVRRIFHDKNGSLWLGTNGDGVCRYDGRSLAYFSTREGLSGNQITGIIEDKDGNLWFSTSGGVSKYDGNSFASCGGVVFISMEI